MKDKEIIEEYQCPGCVAGSNTECGRFKQDSNNKSISCISHCAGTMGTGIGSFFLGMPKGFNRKGHYREMKIFIFRSIEDQEYEWGYDRLNIPTWKYINAKGHVFIRGFSPRINEPFLHIILNGDHKRINCFEITDKFLEEID